MMDWMQTGVMFFKLTDKVEQVVKINSKTNYYLLKQYLMALKS